MEPLSVISLIFNLATYNSNNNIINLQNSQHYYSIADAKQQIFNGKIKNLSFDDLEKFSNFNFPINQ